MVVAQRRFRASRPVTIALICVTLLSLVAPSIAQLQAPNVEPPLREVWRSVFPGEASVEAMTSDGVRFFALTAEGLIRAIDPMSGEVVWETSGWLAPSAARCPYDPPQLDNRGYEFAQPGFSTPLLFVDRGELIVAICAGWENYTTDQELLILDAASGSIRYTWPVIGGRIVSVSNGIMLLDTSQGAVAVGVDERKELWRAEPEDGRVPRAIGISGDVAILTRTDQNYYDFISARDLRDGRIIWEGSVQDIATPRVYSGDRAYTVRATPGAEEGHVLAVSARTGETLWEQPVSPVPSEYELFAGARRLYVRGPYYLDTGLRAFDLDTGGVLWATADGLRVQSIQEVGDWVVFVAEHEYKTRLLVADGSTGEVVWSGLPETRLLLGPEMESLLFLGSSQPGVSAPDAILTALGQR